MFKFVIFLAWLICQTITSAVISTGSSYLASQIGANKDVIGELNHKLLHGLLGGVSGGLTSTFLGRSFEDGAVSGALGAVVAETMAEITSPNLTHEEFTNEFMEKAGRSAKWGEFSGAVTAFMLGYDPEIASLTASNAVENNFLQKFLLAQAAISAYQAYEIYQIYESEGLEKALNKIGIEHIPFLGIGASMKSKTLTSLKKAYDFALSKSPMLRKALERLEGKIEAKPGISKQNLKEQTYKITDKNVDPRLPVGSRHSGQKPEFSTSNEPTNIGGRDYTGHALDRMRERGLQPTAVEETIKQGVKMPGNKPGRLSYFDEKNNITIITELDGTVVSTRFGKLNGVK